MFTPNTSYTISDLKKSSTSRIISIYNRLTGRNAWDMWFNPYEERYTMMGVILSYNPTVEGAMKAQPYKAVQLVVTPDGWAIFWRNAHNTATRKAMTDTNIRLMRQLRKQGETYDTLSDIFNMSAGMVKKICRRTRYANVV